MVKLTWSVAMSSLRFHTLNQNTCLVETAHHEFITRKSPPNLQPLPVLPFTFLPLPLTNTNQPEFDPVHPDGGDPRSVDVNAQYAGYEYHYIYLVFCAFIVWLIIPGIGLLYGGLARRKSALSLLF